MEQWINERARITPAQLLRVGILSLQDMQGTQVNKEANFERVSSYAIQGLH